MDSGHRNSSRLPRKEETGAMTDLPKIVLAPMNFANMPMQIVRELQARGYMAEQVHYSAGQGHKFGFGLDNEVNIKSFPHITTAQAQTLKSYIERDFDIYHFWNKSFVFHPDYSRFTGIDIPLLKARQKKVAFRFTGFDLRLPSWDLERNPHSPFRYGYQSVFSEQHQFKFLAFLREYADRLLVQDPELQQFCPEATIIPRALDLNQFKFIGIAKNDRPLVVHAPSKDVVKGSQFVIPALDRLASEGYAFDFKLIQNMAHAEAVAWYEKADIIIDQILIGATGVLTLEAWALGKPVVLYLREDLFQDFYRTRDLPVANANPDTIYGVLKKLISDYEWRQHLSLAGRRTAEEFHDIRRVIETFIGFYGDLHKARSRIPAGTADIDFLSMHLRDQAQNYASRASEHRRGKSITSLIKPKVATVRAPALSLVAASVRKERREILQAMKMNGSLSIDERITVLHTALPVKLVRFANAMPRWVVRPLKSRMTSPNEAKISNGPNKEASMAAEPDTVLAAQAARLSRLGHAHWTLEDRLAALEVALPNRIYPLTKIITVAGNRIGKLIRKR